MIRVWICYRTVLWVVCDTWTTCDGGWSPHTSPNDFQLRPKHAKLLSWFSDSRAWTIDLNSAVVVQWWWFLYGYTIPLFCGCYMRHDPRLTKVNHSTDHSMTSNYTQDILSDYPGFRDGEHKQYTSSVVYWDKEDDAGMDMLSHYFMSVVWGMDYVWWGGSPHRLQHDL